MDKKPLISVIVPCYNEEQSIPLFYNDMLSVENEMEEVEFEYLFINDGSKDHTLEILRDFSERIENVRYYSFSRNFGKESALYAGLKHAKGDYITVMDADLQDPPEMLKEMYSLIETGEYDCIGTRRMNREGEPPIRSFFATKFYKLMNQISDTHIVDGARDFRLMTRQMVEAILEMTEYNRFSKGIFSWVGFDTYYLEYQNRERVAGETTWSFWGLFKYSLEGIMAFSDFPLTLASYAGIFSFIIAIVIAAALAVRTLIFGNPTSGWTSTIVIILGMGGIQLLSLGVIGKYLGKAFMETKKRPIYILKESSDDKA